MHSDREKRPLLDSLVGKSLHLIDRHRFMSFVVEGLELAVMFMLLGPRHTQKRTFGTTRREWRPGRNLDGLVDQLNVQDGGWSAHVNILSLDRLDDPVVSTLLLSSVHARAPGAYCRIAWYGPSVDPRSTAS
tara:strand:+ start:141 stop:536 length:396 start_codon:yes stop_codon:yes gene_type:complete